MLVPNYLCWSTFGHGIKAKIHKAITFTTGTKEIKEIQAEKPAFARIFPINHTGTIIIERITVIINISRKPMPNIEKSFLGY